MKLAISTLSEDFSLDDRVVLFRGEEQLYGKSTVVGVAKEGPLTMYIVLHDTPLERFDGSVVKASCWCSSQMRKINE